MNYIDELKNKLFPIFKNYNVKEAILFGSFAKNTATDKYDGVNNNIVWDTIKKECSLYYSVAYL